MNTNAGPDLPDVLVTRREAIGTLKDEGAVSIRELGQETDVSRATSHRVLTTLHDHDIVERTDQGKYELTPFGRVVARETETLETRIRTATVLQPLLEQFTNASVAFDLGWFSDATFSQATATEPYKPVQRFDELAAEASTERVLNDGLVAPREIVEGADDRLASGISHTMILDRDTLTLYRERHSDIVEDSFEFENVTTLVVDDVPLDLTLFDERVVFPKIDSSTGAISMLVDTDNPNAMAWGEAVFEECREDATSVEEFIE